jgi:hypothetical protein
MMTVAVFVKPATVQAHAIMKMLEKIRKVNAIQAAHHQMVVVLIVVMVRVHVNLLQLVTVTVRYAKHVLALRIPAVRTMHITVMTVAVLVNYAAAQVPAILKTVQKT